MLTEQWDADVEMWAEEPSGGLQSTLPPKAGPSATSDQRLCLAIPPPPRVIWPAPSAEVSASIQPKPARLQFFTSLYHLPLLRGVWLRCLCSCASGSCKPQSGLPLDSSWQDKTSSEPSTSPKGLCVPAPTSPVDLFAISQILEGISAIPKHFTDVTLKPQRRRSSGSEQLMKNHAVLSMCLS